MQYSIEGKFKELRDPVITDTSEPELIRILITLNDACNLGLSMASIKARLDKGNSKHQESEDLSRIVAEKVAKCTSHLKSGYCNHMKHPLVAILMDMEAKEHDAVQALGRKQYILIYFKIYICIYL